MNHVSVEGLAFTAIYLGKARAAPDAASCEATAVSGQLAEALRFCSVNKPRSSITQ